MCSKSKTWDCPDLISVNLSSLPLIMVVVILVLFIKEFNRFTGYNRKIGQMEWNYSNKVSDLTKKRGRGIWWGGGFADFGSFGRKERIGLSENFFFGGVGGYLDLRGPKFCRSMP